MNESTDDTKTTFPRSAFQILLAVSTGKARLPTPDSLRDLRPISRRLLYRVAQKIGHCQMKICI